MRSLLPNGDDHHCESVEYRSCKAVNLAKSIMRDRDVYIRITRKSYSIRGVRDVESGDVEETPHNCIALNNECKKLIRPNWIPQYPATNN